MGLPNRPSSFMRHRLPWIVAALLVAGIILVTFTFWRSSSRAPQPTEAGQMPRDPAVAATPARHHPARTDRPAAPRDPTTLAMQRLAQHDTERAARHERIQTRVDATNTALAARFRDEKVDPAWSPSKERRLAELSTSAQINEINASIKNLSVDCKSTVCMLSGDFANTSVGDDWFTLYMTNVGAEAPYATYKYVPGKDGRVTIQVYIVGRK